MFTILWITARQVDSPGTPRISWFAARCALCELGGAMADGTKALRLAAFAVALAACVVGREGHPVGGQAVRMGDPAIEGRVAAALLSTAVGRGAGRSALPGRGSVVVETRRRL